MPTIPLDHICYVSVGMVVHADEKVAKGEFELGDLVSEIKDKLHTKPFVEGKHLARWLPATRKWLEWGTERAPALFRRPTFSKLYEVSEKLISVDMAVGWRSCVSHTTIAGSTTIIRHGHSSRGTAYPLCETTP